MKIAILEFPSNLGLKELTPGHEPGVRKLPDWLRKFKFHERIKPVTEYRLEPPAYTMDLDKASGVRNAAAIATYAAEQAVMLKQIFGNDTFALVLGGDCSILIGIMYGLKQKGSYGLFYLDGHTDFVTPDKSGTGGAAGMDLAIVTGYGHDKLTNLDNLKPYVKEEHVWCVGNRYLVEENYVEDIRKTHIHYRDLYDLRKEGIDHCVNEFLKNVSSENLDGFWIHLDVDVLDNEIMPAVDSPQPDGLSYEEISKLLRLLLADKRAAGINITILDPESDPSGKYTEKFVEEFVEIFQVLKNG